MEQLFGGAGGLVGVQGVWTVAGRQGWLLVGVVVGS
jgi:hypothetical protein